MHHLKSRSLAVPFLAITVFAFSQTNNSPAGGRAGTTPPACCLENSTNTSSGPESIRLDSRQLLKLVKKQAPMLPPGGLGKSMLRGKVTVEVCIDQNGAVTAVRIIQGHPLAMGSAIDAVRRWRFIPYTIRGKAKCAAGRLTLKYDWSLKAHHGKGITKCPTMHSSSP
jgi:TonB family protein